jgi:hypothetical protein|tara:strand:- start:1295 stop:1456 length:162 start_codon:yes stop_codon:yes gene_type:complete
MEVNKTETKKPNEKTFTEPPKTTASQELKEITFDELISNAQKISKEVVNKKCC